MKKTLVICVKTSGAYTLSGIKEFVSGEKGKKIDVDFNNLFTPPAVTQF